MSNETLLNKEFHSMQRSTGRLLSIKDKGEFPCQNVDSNNLPFTKTFYRFKPTYSPTFVLSVFIDEQYHTL